MPGIQFSLSESPHCNSRSSSFVDIVFELDNLSPRVARPVSSRPNEETVREILRLLSPVGLGTGVLRYSEAFKALLCLADMLLVSER